MAEEKPELYLVERNNGDKKKHKIIHPFDGRLIALDPKKLRAASQELASKLNLGGVEYIVGFAEGGVLSAYGIAEVANIPLVCSYRVRLKAPNEITFLEPHSERAAHFVYGLKEGSKIVIIEDEITTGSTLLNAVREFSINGILIKDIGTFVLNCESRENILRVENLGYRVKYLYNHNDLRK